MRINLNSGAGTINIMVPEDQISDGLLEILPPPTARTAEGCLAWSIGFSDAFRAPSTSSSSTGVTEDALLGSTPTARTAEGILAWSIGFSDAFRAPSTSSRSAGVTEDALLGSGGATVGPRASGGIPVSFGVDMIVILSRQPSLPNFNNSLLTEESASTTPGTLRATFRASDSLSTTKRLQDEFAAELNAIESQQISLGSNSVQTQSGLLPQIILFSSDVGASNMAPRLFASPLS